MRKESPPKKSTILGDDGISHGNLRLSGIGEKPIDQSI
jgi:hypothetical protein